MRIGTLALASTIVAASLLAACSGGSTSPNPIITPPSSAPAGGGPGPDPNGYNAISVGTVNALGAPMQGDVDLDQSQNGPTLGKCITLPAPASNTNILETFTQNSDGTDTTDLKRYSQSPTCASSQLIAETTRTWAPSTDGASETVNVTIAKYQTPGLSSPTSLRTAVVNYAYSNNFTAYGYPIFQTGTTRDEKTTVTVGGQVVSTTGDEFVYGAPLTNGQNGNSFCGDQTGFNNVGDSTLDETFGWQDQSDPTNGSRVIGSNNQVTLSATRIGTIYTGPIGFMQIQTNSANKACPISTPLYQAEVAGGYLHIPFSLPLAYTFADGFLWKITVTGGEIDNGLYTLNISSKTQSGMLTLFGTITATATNTAIGQFQESINGFGTVTVGNNSYNIADWHVIN